MEVEIETAKNSVVVLQVSIAGLDQKAVIVFEVSAFYLDLTCWRVRHLELE